LHTPQLENATCQRLVERAKQLGFPVSDLLLAKRPL
jgi:lipocalin